jgi:DNA-binding LacI/PurR family transcriptional regulator
MQANEGDLLEENIYCVRSAAAYPHTAEDEKAVTEALRSVLKGPNRPTAIMASFDTMAEVVLNGLVSLGVRVPEDVSLIGWGGTWRDGLFLRRLSSVVVDEEKIGQLASEVLHQMHAGERPLLNKEEFKLDLSLYRGETIGPVNSSPLCIGE